MHWLGWAYVLLLPHVIAERLYNWSLVSNVTYGYGFTKCPDGILNDPHHTCTETALVLDVYQPIAAPAPHPAIVLAHGGGNSGGTKDQGCFQGTAEFFASRGFVAFNINYRLSHDQGTYPNATGLTWSPSWPSAYPAVRDFKAAVRYVRGNAGRYGVDKAKIVGTGGSAGATNALACGVCFEEDYKSEVSLEQDPTLSKTYLEESSELQVVYTHWSSNGEILLAQAYDLRNRTRYSRRNPPVVEFHGDEDTTIPISEAYAVQREYNRTGVDYQLHVLSGCGHGAWGYGCGSCGFKNGTAGYCDRMDRIAWPFIAQHLGL